MKNSNYETKSGVISLINPAKLPYKNILDAMSECAAVLSTHAEFLYVNPALCAMFDQSSQRAVIGKKLFDIFPEKYAQKLLNIIGTAKSHNVWYELDFNQKSSQSVLVKISVSPIIKNQVTIGYITLIINVSENNKAHELLESERFGLAQAQKVAKMGSWETKVSSMTVKWSEETHRIFETDPSKFNPSHQVFLELVHPDDRAKVDNAFISSLTQKADQTLEHRLMMKDGRIKFVEEHWRICLDHNQRPERVLGTCQDITERKSTEQRIQHLAFYDSLTNLPNRQLLLDRLNNIHAASNRHPNYDAVLFIDLDNFKKLNDTQGHNVGDLLLVEVAQRLRLSVRKSDTIGRLGGDEFIVILQGLNVDIKKAAADVENIGKKILNIISEPYFLNSYKYFGSASLGISLFCNQEISVNELLKRADTAMYEAKNAGRNTLRFYDPEMQATLEARNAMENDLRIAVKEGQFQLYFQMQVDHSRKILGAEALIRWPHPKGGLIPPMQFIPLAEETGLILPIGLWVLNTACEQIKAWQKNPQTKELNISINVSARQFHQPDFVDQVIKAVKANEITPSKLKLELTETIVLSNIDDTISKMNTLRKFGIQFSLDDFGTGYSSLSYLTKLPIDELKIDQSFVRNIFTNQKDSIIVQTIIGMAKNLGLEVIAEGVETEIQKAYLEQQGCKFCQGYLFGKPIPVEDFEALCE